MLTKNMPFAGILLATLAACGGGEDPVDDFVLSSGILELEIPNDADRADLPAELDDAIDSIVSANETGVAVTPAIDATYAGFFGLGVDDVGETLVTGTVAATFTMATSDMDIAFTADEISEAGTTIAGSFDSTDLAVTAGLFSGTATGDLTVTDAGGAEIVSVSADLDGAITSAETFGSFEGVATNPDASTDTFGGLFYAAD